MDDKSISPRRDTAPTSKARDLRAWLDVIAARGQLLTIDEEVDPVEEMSAITFMAAQHRPSPALLFRNLKGDRSGSRLLTNMLAASEHRFALSTGIDPALSTRDMITAAQQRMKQRITPVQIAPENAPVSDVVIGEADIDLTHFPMPKFWPGDGGAYFGTGAVTLTRNLATGTINAGVYRQQFYGPKRIGLSMVPGRHGQRNLDAAWAQGRPAEVVVAFGVDPALFIAATQSFGYEESELDVAGGLMDAPLELCRGQLGDLPIIANAEFVIEGLVSQDDLVSEGPLGEFHGFYSGPPARKPVIAVKRVHHRRSPIFAASLMANYPAGEIGAYHAIVRSSRILDNLQAMGIPGVTGAYAHPGSACGYGLVAVSLKQLYPGHVAQVLALTAQCPASVYCTKWIIAVDDDVDPTDIDQVMWAMTTRANPSDDIDILRSTWATRNDISLEPEDRPYGSKALINACTPHKYLETAPPRTFLRRSVYERVTERWSTLGLPGAAPVLDHFHGE